MQDKSEITVSLIGRERVGKTSLISVWEKGDFDMSQPATVGVDHSIINWNYQSQEFKIRLMDTAGQEAYMSMADFYLRGTDLILLCFDPSQDDAMGGLKIWKDVASKHCAADSIILVATKKDLWCGSTPEILKKPHRLMKEMGASQYFESSAQTHEGLREILDGAVQAYLRKDKSQVQQSVNLEDTNKRNNNNNSQGCC